jgi:NADP-dependent 3-hydroxy acid dehydrogenase YdfG
MGSKAQGARVTKEKTAGKFTSTFQHCYVTGGSSGTGLALAVLLTKNGAHVSIVARSEDKLRNALEQLEVKDCPHHWFVSLLIYS